jgi:hypothetical protein
MPKRSCGAPVGHTPDLELGEVMPFAAPRTVAAA